jgi:hypothetical protein
MRTLRRWSCRTPHHTISDMTLRLRNRPLFLWVLAASLASTAGCNGDSTSPSSGGSRSFRMGFSAIPPKADQDVALSNLALWTARADAAIMSVSVPYKAILQGVSAPTYVRTVDLPLAQYYRAKNLQLTAMIDPANGLDRSGEADELVELGRSITEASVQQVYREYVLAVDSILHPTYLGLALETNLIRDLSPSSLYAAIVKMANDAAVDLAQHGSTAKLGVSVQVDHAWGRFLHNNVYQGVEEDFDDFPFIEALGLSSYPYFVFDTPEDIPLDYYSRIPNGRSLPVFVSEGGWSSVTVTSHAGTPELQVRYLRRHADLLEAADAIAVFQLTFADFDLDSFPIDVANAIRPFSYLGVVNPDLSAKPALAVYDSIFALKLR